MRPRSRRVQAQRKFAQGAYVPPNVAAVVAAETRRETTQDARNVTLNHMAASSLLDVVSLQSLTSQPVVLLERLRSRLLARDVPPSPQAETSQPQNLKPTVKKSADPPKVHTSRKKQDGKRVHAMSLRSRRLSKLELNRITAQNSVLKRKKPLKRKIYSSDEDEPLIFQKTRKKGSTVATSESNSKEIVSKVKPTKNVVGSTVATSRSNSKVIVSKVKPIKNVVGSTVATSESNSKEIVSKVKPIKNVVGSTVATSESNSKVIVSKVKPIKNVVGSTVATSESNSKEIVSKVKPIKNVEVPRKTITNLLKTNLVSSKQIKQNSPQKKASVKSVPQKKIRNECTTKQPAEISVPIVKVVNLNCKRDDFVNKPALNNLVSHDSVVAGVLDDSLASDDPIAPNDLVAPEDPVTLYDPIATYDPAAPVDPVYSDRRFSLEVLVVKDELPTNPEDFSDQSEPPMTEEELATLPEDFSDQSAPPMTEEELVMKPEDFSDLSEPPMTEEELATNPEVFIDQSEPPMTEEELAMKPEDFSDQLEPPMTEEELATNPEDLSDQSEPPMTEEELAMKPEDFSDQSEPPMTEEELAGMYEDLAVSNDLPDLDKSSVNLSDDESAVQATDPVEEVTNEAVLVKRDMADQAEYRLESPDDFPILVYGSDASNDEPILRDESTIQDVQYKAVPLSRTAMMDQDENRIAYSPEPGPSGMQFIKNYPDTDQNYDNCSNSSDSQQLTSYFQPYGQNYFSQATGNFETRGEIQTSENCVAAALRPEQDLMTTSKEQLSFRNRIVYSEMPITGNSSGQDNQVAVPEKEGGGTIDVEMGNENRAIEVEIKSEIDADRRMIDEVDTMARTLDREEDAKCMNSKKGTGEESDDEEPDTSELTDGGTLKDAPVYYPSTEEFQDPVTYYESIYPEIVKYGVCKVVPPTGWQPPSEVPSDLRFDATNQYISRLFSRWGPAARELSAIKMCLHNQNIIIPRPPQLDGVELNLYKLYYLVQRLGGLETVINKKRWGKVADDLKFRGGNYEKRLDQIYMKYLLPYDTLSHKERQEIMHRVEIAWNKKNQKLLDRAMNPLYRQKRMLGLMDSSDDEAEEENTKYALKTAEDCILKGSIMKISKFKKVATLTYENTFGQSSAAASPPALEQIEERYWRLVTSGTDHICVHTAAVDTGSEGHGFTTKVEPYASHPWNPKKVIDNPRNVLRYLGSVVGVTLPTLLLGMLFSTSCWHKDPHAVAWYEYQSVGPTRIWYGIPEDQADNFRNAVETLSPTSCQNKSLWLSSEITMIPPSVLRDHNVRLSRVTQNEREFILAVPNAYSCCISTGYTESESVYFAPPSWLDCLLQVFKEARESCEPTMFSMEHLLFNIGCDKQPVLDILKRAQPLYEQILREEVANRQELEERGLTFEQDLLSSRDQDRSGMYRARPQEECDYCRASLFFSKVKGLPARNSVLCLEHALTLLNTEKYKDKDVKDLRVLQHVSIKELHRVHDNMKRRLRKS